ncbi:MAG TPA: hypothetical protein VJ180_04915 [Pyrinomonadaceae bacterium]|nr:hypothetical protein [Pyrinomonadaceae bacterium]
MKNRRQADQNGRLSGVEAALRRASRRARDLAAKTHTPLVIFSKGRIQKLRVKPKPAPRSS